MRLAKQSLQFSLYEDQNHVELLEAYERLIYDAMVGDRSLFANAQGIERLWEVSSQILETPPPVHSYAQESWGPDAIHELIAPRSWRLPFARKWRGPH